MTVESPSTEVEQVVPGENADSQPVEGAKQDEALSPLDAVKAALKEDSDADKKAEGEEGGRPESPEQVGDGKQQDQADPHEEFVKNLSPNKREHWKRLERERDAYREKAEAFEKVSGAVREAGLSSEEFSAGFNIMRAIKDVSNGRATPAQALEMLEPYVQQLRAMAGDVLPDDLQERISEGTISRDEAKELARLREQNRILQSRIQAEDQASEAERVQRETETFAASLAAAATKWETAWAKSDPDYEVKKPLVRARVLELMQAGGLPKGPDEAVKLSQDALADINKQLSGVLQRRGNVQTVTGGRPSGTPKPAPKSALDVVNIALTGG